MNKLNKQQKQAKTLDFGSVVRKAQSGDTLALGQLKNLDSGDIDYNRDYGSLNVKDLQWLYNNVPNLKGITDQAFEDYAIRNHITKDEAMKAKVDIADAMKSASAENRARQADLASKNDDKWNPMDKAGSGNKKQVAQGNLEEDRPLTKAEERRAYDKSITDEESKDVDTLQKATEEVKTGATEKKPSTSNGVGSKQDASITTENASTETTPTEEITDDDKFKVGDKVDDIEKPKDVEEAKNNVGENKFNALLNAWKEGKLKGYPTLKALIDSIAKNGQMWADRANVLTGKGSDTSIYTPIETETDKRMDSMREGLANFDVNAMNAEKWMDMSDEEREAWVKMANQNGVSIDQLTTMLSSFGVANAQALIDNAMKRDTEATKQAQQQTEKGYIELANLTIEQAKNLQGVIDQLSQRKLELEGELRSLTDESSGETYARIASAYIGTYRGLNSVNAVNSTTDTKENTNGGTFNQSVGPGTIPEYFVKGETKVDWSNTNTSSSTSSNMSSSNADILAINNLPSAEAYAKMGMEERRQANERMRNAIQQEINRIDATIEQWQSYADEARGNVSSRMDFTGGQK